MPIVIHLPEVELFNEFTNRFTTEPAVRLEMEHSLVSLSKWESKHHKPFLGKEQKTNEEAYSYLQMMVIDPEDVPLEIIQRISRDEFERINEYIDDKQTATWFTERPGQRPSREVVTNELIYHWITAMTIDKSVEYWHLNRLFTLLKVVNEKNQPPKKQTRAEIAANHRAINAANKARMGGGG